MSNDEEYTTVSSEQEMTESRKHLLQQQDEVITTRSNRYRNSEQVKAVVDDELFVESKKFPLWLRILFWVFRKSLAPIIMIVMLLAGLYIGYVIVGGQPKEDVFELSTWKHMWDLIFADS
jgi:hypothetical protein